MLLRKKFEFCLIGEDSILIGELNLSGKTLAFGVPALMHFLQKRKSQATKKLRPLCLVLSPTRELAQQV